MGAALYGRIADWRGTAVSSSVSFFELLLPESGLGEAGGASSRLRPSPRIAPWFGPLWCARAPEWLLGIFGPKGCSLEAAPATSPICLMRTPERTPPQAQCRLIGGPSERTTARLGQAGASSSSIQTPFLPGCACRETVSSHVIILPPAQTHHSPMEHGGGIRTSALGCHFEPLDGGLLTSLIGPYGRSSGLLRV